MQPSQCPQCKSEHIYQDGYIWICPECAYEFNPEELAQTTSASDSDSSLVVRDANGNELKDGDTVTVIKELKVKGASSIKAGTKVKNIRLTPDASDGHDISCRIDGFGAMGLKSEFVKKA